MLRKNQLILFSMIFILFLGFTVGCTSENNEKFESAIALMESAGARINNIDFDVSKSDEIRSQLNAVIVDLNEASNILDTIEPSSDKDKKMIAALKSMIQVDIIFCEMAQTDLLDAYEHMNNAVNHAKNRNIAAFRSETQSLINSFENSKSKLVSAEQYLNEINMDDLPPKAKGDLEYLKSTIEELEKSIDNSIAKMDTVLTTLQSY